MRKIKLERRHFEFIAAILKELGDNTTMGSEIGRRDVAHTFANKLRATNPAFNYERFMKACGVEE